ncbi:MAG: hypothetical protein EOM76_08925 [Sphingobacteriia bacterium]|nr:hypothetical protein [Sphingobacteriia bacterium]
MKRTYTLEQLQATNWAIQNCETGVYLDVNGIFPVSFDQDVALFTHEQACIVDCLCMHATDYITDVVFFE